MGSLIRDVYLAMIEAVEKRLVGTDLILSQWLVLQLIDLDRIACIGDVSRELGLDSGASTRLVDQIEMKGLVRRRRSTTDRRVVGLSLTPAGGEMLYAMRPRIDAFWDDRLQGFDTNERNVLIDLLKRLRARLRAGTELNGGDADPERIAPTGSVL